MPHKTAMCLGKQKRSGGGSAGDHAVTQNPNPLKVQNQLVRSKRSSHDTITGVNGTTGGLSGSFEQLRDRRHCSERSLLASAHQRFQCRRCHIVVHG